MGYTLMAARLAVTDGQDNYSSSVGMGGGNAVQVESICFNLGGATSYTIAVEGSNDGSNWTNITTNAGLVLGYNAPTKSTGIGFAMIRYRYSVSAGTGTIIISAGCNISHQ